MRIVTLSDGTVQILPDSAPEPTLDTTTVVDSAAPDQPAAPAESPVSDSVNVSAEQFRILRSYGHMSSEELFMTHYNREKPRADSMSDDDLLQLISELELIVQIGKIRQRAADDIRLERIESKSKSEKEKQKLKDSSFKIKKRTELDAEKLAIAEAEKKKKGGSSDIDKLMNYLGMTREEAEAHLNKGKK